MARLRIAALPVLIAGCGVLLVCGGLSSHALWPWLVLIGAAIAAVARWGLADRTLGREAVENAALAAVAGCRCVQENGCCAVL